MIKIKLRMGSLQMLFISKCTIVEDSRLFLMPQMESIKCLDQWGDKKMTETLYELCFPDVS